MDGNITFPHTKGRKRAEKRENKCPGCKLIGKHTSGAAHWAGEANGEASAQRYQVEPGL